MALKPAVCILLKSRQTGFRCRWFWYCHHVLVLEAEFERMFVLHPQQAVLKGVVVIVVLEVPGIRTAPASGSVGPAKSCFQKSVAGVTGGKPFEAGLG